MFRNNSKTRRTVHFGIEHHEREDLHFPLVLVHHLGLNHKRRFPRSTGHYLDVISENSSLADATLNTTKGRRRSRNHTLFHWRLAALGFPL